MSNDDVMHIADAPCNMLQGDVSKYIERTWIDDYRASMSVKHVPASVYYRWEAARIAGIMKTAAASLAYHPNDLERSMVLGYAIHTDNWLHWFHVRDIFKGFGIGKQLLLHVLCKQEVREYAEIVVTHYMPPKYPSQSLFQNRIVTYHPYYGLETDSGGP